MGLRRQDAFEGTPAVSEGHEGNLKTNPEPQVELRHLSRNLSSPIFAGGQKPSASHRVVHSPKSPRSPKSQRQAPSQANILTPIAGRSRSAEREPVHPSEGQTAGYAISMVDKGLVINAKRPKDVPVPVRNRLYAALGRFIAKARKGSEQCVEGGNCKIPR